MRIRSRRFLFGGRVLGVEGSLNWTSPNEVLTLGGNATYIDYRNTSSEGAIGTFDGDRIPNRPYVLANALARLKFDEVLQNDLTRRASPAAVKSMAAGLNLRNGSEARGATGFAVLTFLFSVLTIVNDSHGRKNQ